MGRVSDADVMLLCDLAVGSGFLCKFMSFYMYRDVFIWTLIKYYTIGDLSGLLVSFVCPRWSVSEGATGYRPLHLLQRDVLYATGFNAAVMVAMFSGEL